MPPTTKGESSPALVAAIDRLEKQSDTCYQGLQLLTREWNFAEWISLTECARRLESLVQPAQYGSGQHKAIVTNLSRVAAQMCKFARDHGNPRLRAPSGFRWSDRFGDEAAIAFDVAWQYSMFCIDFPAWHKNLYAAELVSSDTIRFHAGTSTLARRVSAYEKGIRPAASKRNRTPEEMPSLTQKLTELFREVLRGSEPRGRYRVQFGNTDRLRGELAQMYSDRLAKMFRRYPDISVGTCTLGQFRNFYTGLLALVGAHDYLCFRWSQAHGQPLESYVMVFPRSRWVQLIAKYSGLSEPEILSIIPDLTFGGSQAQDLQVMPFVPLARESSLLAVSPPFALASNWEENILRVCSYLRPKTYSTTSLSKEDEMRDQLRNLAHSSRKIAGPWKLGKGVPDLDLAIDDAATKVLVLAELKWPRKPYAPREIVERDAELRKGVAQIKAIKNFLTANPRFLVDRNYVSRSISDYCEVHYCVISRDHLIATDDPEFPVYAYDAFSEEVPTANDAPSFLRSLNRMEWLPVEGKDFKSQWITSHAGGVTVYSEQFLLEPQAPNLITT
jgi:hypothetical protein